MYNLENQRKRYGCERVRVRKGGAKPASFSQIRKSPRRQIARQRQGPTFGN